MRGLAPLLLALVAVAVILACGGRGQEESVTIDGRSITEPQFKAMKSAVIEFIDAFAEEDWGRIYDLLDAESKQACSRFEFVTNVGGAVGFAKTFLGEQWWKEVVRALREAEDLMRSITWEELRDDPVALEQRLEQRLNEIFGASEEEDSSGGFEDWRFEDGQAKLHWPDACESIFSDSG